MTNIDLDAYFGHKAEPEGFRSGFVALMGRPNAGKSTLLNQLLGQKIAIVSDKPQTTRTKIQGIYTDERMQVVFFDTPGIHKPKSRLGEYMNKAADSVCGDVDIICYLVDASRPFYHSDEVICGKLLEGKAPVFLLLNKIDLLDEEAALRLQAECAAKFPFAGVLLLSAAEGENVDELLDVLHSNLPVGPKYFDEEQVTDQPERQIMAEIIREKLFLATRDEVPHSAAVMLEQYKRRENGVLYLEAYIYVERDSQKGIVIGRGGSMLRQIGSSARAELEELFGEEIFLDLRVKVRKDWRDDPRILKGMGYDEKKL